MKDPKKSRPGKKKLKAKDGEARLPSNCLLLQLSTERYLSSTGRSSSRQFFPLECIGYSEPRWCSLVKSTKARMGICWSLPWKYHGGSETSSVPFVWERIRWSTERTTILLRIWKWIRLILLEHFFTISNGFQKHSSSIWLSATTNKLAAWYLILARSRFYGIKILRCSRIKFIIQINSIQKFLCVHCR